MKQLVAALSVVFSLFACAGSGGEGDGPPSRRAQDADSASVLRIGLMPTLDCLPFYYAASSGIFDSLGVEVDLQTFMAQMDLDTALSGGHLDGIYSDLVRSALLQSKDTFPVVVMGCDGAWKVVTSQSLRLRNPSQLEERMVAVARHSATDFMADRVAQAGGLPADMIYRPQINHVGLRTEMLDNAQVEAAVLPEPQATQAAVAGHRIIYSSEDENVRLGCVTFDRAALSRGRKAEMLGRLFAGYDVAVGVLNRRGKSACDSLLRIGYGLSARVVDSLRLPRYEAAHLPAAADVRAAVEFLRGRRLVPPGYDADSLVSPAYLK